MKRQHYPVWSVDLRRLLNSMWNISKSQKKRNYHRTVVLCWGITPHCV